MSDPSHREPVAAEPSGDPAQAWGKNLEPSAWLLELGAVSRTVEFRSELQQGRGHPLRAWSSRRAGVRARRDLVRQALAAIGVEEGFDAPDPGVISLPEPSEPAGWHDTVELPAIVKGRIETEPAGIVALPPVQAEEPEPDVEPEPDADGAELTPASPSTDLLERIGAYTGRSSLSVR